MSLWATSTLCFNGSSFVFSKLGFSESYAFAIKKLINHEVSLSLSSGVQLTLSAKQRPSPSASSCTAVMPNERASELHNLGGFDCRVVVVISYPAFD